MLDEAGSTNDVLAGLVREGDEPHFSTVVTMNQTAGRGRLGRSWVAPEGKALAASVLLRPILPSGSPLAPDALGWLPLIAGAAMSSSVDALIGGGRTGLKWPNDVQVDGLKVCGVLAELVPTSAVIVGTGVNLALDRDELPVATATSLTLAGVEGSVDELADLVLSRYLARLAELLGRFLDAGADAQASGIHRATSEWCRTLGRQVRVSLPGGDELFGVATGIDASGCLLVRSDPAGEIRAVAAGDVTHLRYE
jgi:BirA family transcriptional regulator, biotin operon repressor / biotin---[acetyl-CoA-carboxylase] ligase